MTQGTCRAQPEAQLEHTSHTHWRVRRSAVGVGALFVHRGVSTFRSAGVMGVVVEEQPLPATATAQQPAISPRTLVAVVQGGAGIA